MLEWIKSHPVLTGLIVAGVGLLFIILKNSGGGSSQPQVVQSGPSEALQAAQLQAGVQTSQIAAASQANADTLSATIAKAQIDANSNAVGVAAQQNVALANIAASAQTAQYHDAATLSLGQTQANDAVALGTVQSNNSLAGLVSNNQTSVAVAGIQGAVQEAAYAAATEQQNIVSSAGVAQSKIIADTQNHISDNQFNATLAGYGTQVDLANIGAGVQHDTIAAQLAAALASTSAGKDVALANINAQQNVADTTINAQSAYQTLLANLTSQYDTHALDQSVALTNAGLGVIQSGTFNKGGQGGANQVSAIAALFGQNAAAANAQASANGLPGNSVSSILGGIANLVGSAFGGFGKNLFGGGSSSPGSSGGVPSGTVQV